MADGKCYCDEHKERKVKIDNLEKKDSLLCQSLEKEKIHTEMQIREVYKAIGEMGVKLDKFVPRWAFLLLVSVLILLTGFQVTTIVSIDKQLSIFADRYEQHQEIHKQIERELNRNYLHSTP